MATVKLWTDDRTRRARSAGARADRHRRLDDRRLRHPFPRRRRGPKGMTDAQHGDLLAVIAMASQTNALVTALRLPVDAELQVA